MTIVAATDFSPCSQTATRLAAALARRRNASLILVHTLEPLPVDPAVAPMGGAWEGELARAAEQALDVQAQGLRKSGLVVEAKVRFGTAAAEILAIATAAKADLIVVGTHGRRGVARLFLGSCAEAVVRRSTCPVLVTGADAADPVRWTSTTPLKLTVVTDGSRACEAAFAWVRSAENTSTNRVSLVRVYWPPQEAAHYGLDEAWQDGDGHPELLRLLERDLRRDARSLVGASDPPMRFTVAAHDAGEAIRDDLRQLGADAIVLGVPTNRRGTGLKVTSILRSASVPVFCIPEQASSADHHIRKLRTVLIPCDLSDTSLGGILPAYALLLGGGRAELLYVHSRETVTSAESGLLPRPPLSEDERATIEARLRAAAPPAAAEYGIATHASVAEGDATAEAILQAAERLDVDVIAIGSHGRSGLKRAVLGSVAEEVARRSTRPVLIVPASRVAA